MDTGPAIEPGAHVRVLTFSENHAGVLSRSHIGGFFPGTEGDLGIRFLVFQDHRVEWRRNFFRFKRQWCFGRLLRGTVHRYDILFGGRTLYCVNL